LKKLSSFHFPTNIIFGAGSSNVILDHLKVMKPKNVLIVSDPNVVKLDFFDRITNAVRDYVAVEVFSSFSPNPISTEIDKAKTSLSLSNPSLIIGLGGGASIDVAKALSVSLSHPEKVLSYDEALGGDKKIDPQKIIPTWAIPTTSGTGSEVGRSAVISDEVTKQKKILFHPQMIPRLVFCDPELTQSLPPKVTAQTGIDAFVHLFEAYCAPGFHPMADGIATEGMRLIEKSLIRSINAPDMESRTNMMAAAMMGAVAFQKGLGNIHSCAHSLSACFDIHHGLANGVMLPYGAQINIAHLGNKAETIAKMFGTSDSKQEDLPHLLLDLVSESGLPTNLGAFDIMESDCDKLSKFAFEDGCHFTNAKPMTEVLFRKMFISAL